MYVQIHTANLQENKDSNIDFKTVNIFCLFHLLKNLTQTLKMCVISSYLISFQITSDQILPEHSPKRCLKASSSCSKKSSNSWVF